MSCPNGGEIVDYCIGLCSCGQCPTPRPDWFPPPKATCGWCRGNPIGHCIICQARPSNPIDCDHPEEARYRDREGDEHCGLCDIPDDCDIAECSPVVQKATGAFFRRLGEIEREKAAATKLPGDGGA